MFTEPPDINALEPDVPLVFSKGLAALGPRCSTGLLA